MNELVNDDIKLSKLEINTGFINGLRKKWLAFCQSLRNTNHVKESELASLFGKLKYEENLINSIYDTNQEKTLVPATPLSTAFFSSSIVQDFQDRPDDEEDTRSGQEYMNDLEEEYQARALLAKSKRFFKKGTQRFSSAKVTNQTECHKCGKKGHFASGQRHQFLHIMPQLPVHPQANKGLIGESYDLDEEEMSSDDNEVTEVKALWLLLMKKEFLEQIPTQKKKILGIDQLTEDTSNSRPKDPVFVKSSADNSEVSITGSNKPKLSEAEDSTLLNHDTGKHPLPPLEKLTGAELVSRPKNIKSILKSKYTFKAETINEPSSTLARGNKSSSTSKTNSSLAGKLKNMKMEDDPSLAIVMKELNELKLKISKNKSSYMRNNNSQQRTNHRTCDHAEFMSSMNINQYHTGQGESSLRSRPARPAIPFPSCIHYGYNDHKSDDCVHYPICEIYGSYDHDTHGHNRIISLRRGIKSRNPQHVTKNCETCGSNIHTTSEKNNIK
ncbi:hypothetical protein Tco_0554015 [Tanacetum coccineum]